MKLDRFLPIFAFFLLCGHSFAKSNLSALAEDAVFGDSDRSARATNTLRSHKQKGLNALFDRFEAEIKEFRDTGHPGEDWQRISAAIDEVSQQKDGYSSRLFWHTDLTEAMREAQKQNKPVVSLRLLGKLSEEYSCANSRFFRSILYSDPAIAKNLRENFVLHWQTVRPAPKLTIDFGDGRKLIRTITGNSIHYFLSNTGQIYDALPGLYDPETFDRYLVELRTVITNGDAPRGSSNGYRLKKGSELIKEWRIKLEALGRDTDRGIADTDLEVIPDQPTAVDAMPRAATKAFVEMPAVLALMPQAENLRRITELDGWKPLARLSRPVRISDPSLKMIRSKSGEISDEEYRRLINNLKEYIAIDTVQNEYRFHLKIMALINSATAIEPLNKLIYSNLFLTPDSDQWLGLYAPDIYSAIENNGIVSEP